VLQDGVLYNFGQDNRFVMFYNQNRCQLYNKSFIMELMEDISPYTLLWGRFSMLDTIGQPWIEMFMNFVKLVICCAKYCTFYYYFALRTFSKMGIGLHWTHQINKFNYFGNQYILVTSNYAIKQVEVRALHNIIIVINVKFFMTTSSPDLVVHLPL
jgi:hypothetical protein